MSIILWIQWSPGKRHKLGFAKKASTKPRTVYIKILEIHAKKYADKVRMKVNTQSSIPASFSH